VFPPCHEALNRRSSRTNSSSGTPSARCASAQVAEWLGVDPTFVGRLERGQRGAHWRTIRRILAAVDASVSDFASEIDAAERLTRS
jgi:transcriptional regulator with XRE-family HTH domain